MSAATITLLFLLFAVVMFVFEKIPLGVTSMIVCIGLVFATMSSDELKKVATIKEFIFVATILIIFQPVSYCLTCIIRECEL